MKIIRIALVALMIVIASPLIVFEILMNIALNSGGDMMCLFGHHYIIGHILNIAWRKEKCGWCEFEKRYLKHE